MRIDHIRIDGFGTLERLEAGPGLGGLVVVLGPNEAGKSTLFTFLTTALYGFQPASRDLSPHIPWGENQAAGRIRLRLGGGDCAEIERRLRSQPSARLTVDGKTTDLRNHPLPWVEHVPRRVFRQVFAVTLGDLAGLDGETWARIQDRMVGSMGASDLRSAREVADDLEREAGEIWRPNRRGNQSLRDLQAEIRALRGRRLAAHERDRRVRSLIEEREEVRRRLGELRERRARERAEIERAQTVLPVKRVLDRIALLRAEGGPRGALEALPDDPPARLADLEEERARLRQRRKALEHELRERKTIVDRLDEAASELLVRRDEIARLLARVDASRPDRARARELQEELGGIESDLDDASAGVLDVDWRGARTEALASVPIALLRERIARARHAPEGSLAPRAAPGSALFAGLAGLALVAWWLLGGPATVAVLGAALAGGGVAVWLLSARGRAVEPARAGVRAEVSGLLADLPIRSELLEHPDEGLVAGLEHLRTLLRERDRCRSALDAACDRVTAVDEEVRRVARGLGREANEEPEVVATLLERDLSAAEHLQEGARVAAVEARRLRLDLDEVSAALEGLEPELERLRDAGSELGDDDVERGLEEARARLAAHERADQLEDELRRAHPDLDALRARLEKASGEADSWTLDHEALELAKDRAERYDGEIEELLRRGEALQSQAEHLRELETVDAVDGETASLREEEGRLVRERDRRWVLAQLLREADRRFREEHQPDLIRRAGSYLEHLTGGRYERLLVDETGEGDLFQLVGPGLPAPVPLASPVSTGTLEQAYLSLRLAIVDHLDQGGERLPLFIDEVFVNWDPERRARGLEVLAGIAASRQVFVFTCHPPMAQELERRGGSVLRLDPAA